jgi:hypothetical protein
MQVADAASAQARVGAVGTDVSVVMPAALALAVV